MSFLGMYANFTRSGHKALRQGCNSKSFQPRAVTYLISETFSRSSGLFGSQLIRRVEFKVPTP